MNQLQHFYPPQALQAVLNRLGTVDFRRGSPLDIYSSVSHVSQPKAGQCLRLGCDCPEAV